jgi:hypothetical protein
VELREMKRRMKKPRGERRNDTRNSGCEDRHKVKVRKRENRKGGRMKRGRRSVR